MKKKHNMYLHNMYLNLMLIEHVHPVLLYELLKSFQEIWTLIPYLPIKINKLEKNKCKITVRKWITLKSFLKQLMTLCVIYETVKQN
jgi:hypothetical protein